MQARDLIKTKKPLPYIPKSEQPREKAKSWERNAFKRQQDDS